MRRITPASDERRISGSVKLGRAGEVLLVVEPDADAVGDAAAAAGALVRRGLADRLDRQLLDLAAVAVALDARRAGVDHVADARHGQRGLGHVGGQHDAAARCAASKTRVLLGLRQPREQRQHLDAGRMVLAQRARRRRGSRARRAGRPARRRPSRRPRQSSSTASAIASFEVVVARSRRTAASACSTGIEPARDLDHRRRPVGRREVLREAVGVDRRRGDDRPSGRAGAAGSGAGSRAGSRC